MGTSPNRHYTQIYTHQHQTYITTTHYTQIDTHHQHTLHYTHTHKYVLSSHSAYCQGLTAHTDTDDHKHTHTHTHTHTYSEYCSDIVSPLIREMLLIPLQHP